MPSQETIMKWVVGIGGGVIVLLQGVNIHDTGQVKQDTIRIEAETGEELDQLRALVQSAKDGLEKQKLVIKQQQETLDILKANQTPSPNK